MLFAGSGLDEAGGVAATVALNLFVAAAERVNVRTGFGSSWYGVGDGFAFTLAGGIAGRSSEPLAEFSGVGDGIDELAVVRLDSGTGVDAGGGVGVGVGWAASLTGRGVLAGVAEVTLALPAGVGVGDALAFDTAATSPTIGPKLICTLTC